MPVDTAISDLSTPSLRTGFGQDPLCQTFYVIGSPVILCSLDLYFYTKDSILPLFLELRSVVNEVPTQTVIPFSRVTVFPDFINTSDDATTATNITFDGLVYLQPGEYAIVLNSNSSRYRAWISQLGEIDVATEQPIVSQPYIGKLYKSQNASTWIPSPNQDLKFKLYRAKFTNTNTGIVDLKVDAKQFQTSWMEPNPLVSYPSSATLKVLHPNHGLTTGSYAKLSGFDSVIFRRSGFSNIFGINVATIDNVEFAVSNVKQNSYTITLPATSNVTSITRAGGMSLSAQKDLRFDAIIPHVVSLDFGGGSVDVKGKFTTLGYTLDSFIDINKNKVTELSTSKVIPSTINVVNNMSNVNPFTIRLELNSDNEYISPLIDMSLQSVILTHNQVNTPTYSGDNLTNDIVTVASRNNIFFTRSSNTVGLISLPSTADKANASLVVKGTTVTVTGSGSNNRTFRVLDILNSGANIQVYGNVVTESAGSSVTVTNGTGFIAEEAARGGSSLSKYISRQFNFANPSTGFNIRLDVSEPENSSVRIFYKVKEVGDTAPLIDEEFVELTGLDITTSRGGEYYEVEKQIDSLIPFNAIMVKIVLESTDSAIIPKCKNLRLIALA